MTARECIVRAVLDIIGEDGVAAVTNRRIARQAGVSLGSVTYHFPCQHDLLRESLRYFVAEETRRLTELADRHQGGTGAEADGTGSVEPGLEQARALVAQVTAHGHESIAPFELFIQAGRDPRLRTAAAECFAAFDRVAARILAALGVPDAHAAAATAVALVLGAQLRRVATGEPAGAVVAALLLLAGGTALLEPRGLQ